MYKSAYVRKRAARHKKAQSAGGILKSAAGSALLAAILSLTLIGVGARRARPRLTLRYASDNAAASASPSASPSAADGEEYLLASQLVCLSENGEPRNMPLEEYLVGVVAAEMPASSEKAALEAQAVAARTFTALHMAGGAKCTKGCEGCDVCSDPSCCQAYMSDAELRAFWGGDYEANIRKVREAVAGTEGLVLLYNGRLISALYHASSGPATENSEAVFAVALPYLVSVDSFEGETEAVSVQRFSEAELAEIINSEFADAHLTPPLKPNDIEVWGRTESGRVQLVKLGETVVTGVQLRRLLGLKSADFTVELSGGVVSFTCIGYGHGVGMSQYGANEMAKEGYEFDEILFHFYTGTELARLRYGG